MAPTPANPADQQGSRPVPDPTVLTTDQLRREISGLEKSMLGEVKVLESLVLEKFRGVDRQFELVERQRVEQKQDTKSAVDAALIAQKEAVREQTTAFALATDKSERGVSEQLKQLGTTFDTAIQGVNTSLNDMKDRLTKIESIKLGGQESKAALYAAAAFIVGLVVVVVALVGFALANRPT